MCNSGEVEDEVHFIVQCPAYSELRKKLLGNSMGENGTDLEKFVNIMITTDEKALLTLGKYVSQCAQKRKVDG